MRKTFIIIISIFFVAACIKEVTPDIRITKKQLVVEGLLMTDSTPCKVILSYSGTFNYRGSQTQDFINDAVIYLKNTDGASTKLTNQGNGVYIQTENDFIAETGKSYYINITLSDGEEYASVPETIVPVPKNFEIDSIVDSQPFRLTDLHGANVKIKLNDPANEKNYYRWVTTDYIPRKATGCCCFPVPCFQYCFQYYEDFYPNILSDVNINGNEIRGQSVVVSPYYWYGNHYLNIKQLSLTPEAYQFWKLYEEQTTRTGTILDPLPAPIRGNIYNTKDTSSYALGYFEASDCYSKKIILQPLIINAYIILMNVEHYIGVGACYVIYPNATTDGPEGWETAPKLIYNVY